MPEEQTTTQTKGKARFVPNWLRFGKLRGVGEDPTTFKVVEELKKEIPLDALRTLHKRIKEKEQKMKDLISLRVVLAKKWMEVGYLMDPKAVDKEMELIESGTGWKSKPSIGLFDVPVDMVYPESVNIAVSPEIGYSVSYIKDGEYWKSLEMVVSGEIDRLKNENKESNEINTNLEAIKIKANLLISQLKEGIESKQTIVKTMLTDAKTHLVDINKNINKIEGMRIDSNDVYYVHTYKVVKLLTEDDKNELINNKGYGNWDENDKENIGRDEHGWPLEVSDGNVSFNNQILPEGTILIDVYKTGSIGRSVPKEFIMDCNAIDTVNWLISEYDALICDLRDGRYHAKSTTAMDFIMADLKVPDISHPQSRRKVEAGNQAQITMKLHVGGSVTMPMQPTHLSPAFDFKGRGVKIIHKGRKYYYDTQEFCEQSDDRMVSSRGAALYIVHRVLEKTKYFDPAPGSKGALEIIKYISSQTDGLDIGANYSKVGEQYTAPFG